MLFHSIDFAIFLPIVFILYWFVFKRRRWQNLLIVMASYLFYGWWDWRFLLLIAVTSISSFSCGILIERHDTNKKIQRAISAFNIILNLLILCFFKYFNFFIESIVQLFSSIGIKLDWVTIQIILPVGISFYTFQALSYTIDIYQKKQKATKDVIEFLAYISFFPQLVAGPIERATHLLPQFQTERRFSYPQAVDGARQMLWGFFKKLVIADNCGSIVDIYWNYHEILSGPTLVLIAILFSFQIYCDFSGYSDIAIGCARLFGINLMRNFNNPYFSRNIAEFWRKWHISLTTWLRDYIYVPLGGNRCSPLRVTRNIFIIWGISGLWHGANWTFVCWGLYHAVLLSIHHLMKASGATLFSRLPHHSKHVTSIPKVIFTFGLTTIGWVIFRAHDIKEASSYLMALFTHPYIHRGFIDGKKWFVAGIVLLSIEWIQRNRQHALDFSDKNLFRYRIARWIVYYALITCILNFSASNHTFIYFQF